ncbi:MAG: hypothetical protein ACFFEA_13285 [Candidatus Thorarchaeota archaeon]
MPESKQSFCCPIGSMDGGTLTRAGARHIQLSQLIPKNHFCSMSFFRESPLINWTYTSAVLLTAYDVHRSNDFWIDSVIRSGKTLKEEMIELGLSKDVALVADTGVFEMEARKAGISRNLGIDVGISLSSSQIIEAYELSGADVFVAPDEIILATDEKHRIREKIATMKDKLHSILEIAKPESLIAVIQGHDKNTMTNLFDFYRSQGIMRFAIGGLIPLWTYDKNMFQRVIHQARELTRGFWLHAFGLPVISLLPFYLHEVGMDSVDTSTLLYMTASRKYLVGLNPRPVRLAHFSQCNCSGCRFLNPDLNPRGHNFFIHLYIHNFLEAVKAIETGLKHSEEYDNKVHGTFEESAPQEQLPNKRHSHPQDSNSSNDWKTALDAFKGHSSFA